MINRRLSMTALSLTTLCSALMLSGCSAPVDATTATETSSASAEQQSGWLTFTAVGTGPDVILLPGLASSGDVWDGTVDALMDRYRFHIANVAGFAGQPVGDHRDLIIDGLSQDVSTYITAQSLDAPTVVGHSMGGFTSLHIGRDHGDQVSGVISVDSLPFYPLIFDPNASVETSRVMGEAMVGQMRAMPQPSYDDALARNAAIFAKSEDDQARITGWGQASDRDTVLESMLALMTTDIRPDLASIDVPVTVIYAHDERMGVSPAAMDALYANAYVGTPDLSLTRIDNSFHFVMDDQPDAFVAAMSAALPQ
ncbi:alpha/beta hydrolase [Algimonas arctica]|uniref:Alpha/beta hydrolase n=1 Tax=Algimonas arctica TaxID=1479486 RepID=A0A8J3G1P6_9PROT|nr:alpha/beta hydrolase [Algimonas arctica]GHA88098.1 alpha/beta hydrolase [Algimonas arctica]